MTQTPNWDEIITGDVDSWVSTLPDYQRAHIERMLRDSEPLEVATQWLAGTGPANTAPYGGVRAGARRFYDSLLVELQKLFCGDAQYEEDRQSIGKAVGGGKLVIVGAVSTAIAPHVGAAAVLIGPAVALTLGVMGNAAQSSICGALGDAIAARQGQDDDQSAPS